MLRGLWSAASGMAAQKLTIDVISNNLANVNTVGFKKSRSDFQDLMYQTLKQAGSVTESGAQIPTGIQIGMGTMPVGVQKMFTQGDFKQTENELDLAIEGKGFFKVLSNGEEFYTRAGNFKLDSDGNICTPNGDRLQPEMTVPQGTVSINIDKTGTVTVFDSSGTGTSLGTIEIYTFPNPSGLFSLGHNLYRPTDASGDPISGTAGSDGVGTIAQGFLEMSNVDVVEEMVSMIMAQRAYEINSKAIQTADSMMQMANNVKR
ncbi:MAG: flagellar basal-body rod protein FlgG [Deltaproteobacteria bacterium]|nr:flagellar basal-body rod protein FlgG [Deltaproteobacteria bacterium]MBW1918616.1 flagellar basal-body rod protein FlgG [Deltaproteobacteria bacterium]MBW1934056.1 flagellar basal-body rod protein FlgG [Deltaproteobacteria bacterium]MBW1976372.1 flagellar basal-body rod protein FlgG [Deltaproteobacteria bacterium]MBW2043350.1 flagellar basal-body rod protein FlgG [Deltaproteobacteria bacterium]